MYYRFFRIVFSFACCFGACAADARADGERVVVTFGDSTTAARGELKVYSQVLADELEGIKVINAGVGGDNTDHARARFEKDVRAHHPDVERSAGDAIAGIVADLPGEFAALCRHSDG